MLGRALGARRTHGERRRHPYRVSNGAMGVEARISPRGIPSWISVARIARSARPSGERHPNNPISGRLSICARREMASHRVRSVRWPEGSRSYRHSSMLKDIPHSVLRAWPSLRQPNRSQADLQSAIEESKANTACCSASGSTCDWCRCSSTNMASTSSGVGWCRDVMLRRTQRSATGASRR